MLSLTFTSTRLSQGLCQQSRYFQIEMTSFQAEGPEREGVEQMKTGIVAAGIVLIVLSVGWYLLVPFSPIIAAYLCIASPVLFIMGILLFIVGLVMDSEPRTVVHYQVPAQPQPTASTCPGCGYPLEWISQRQRYYCHRCKRYR